MVRPHSRLSDVCRAYGHRLVFVNIVVWAAVMAWSSSSDTANTVATHTPAADPPPTRAITATPVPETQPHGITCPNIIKQARKQVLNQQRWTQYSARCKIGQGMWKDIAPNAYVKMGIAFKAVLGFNTKSRILDAASGCGNLMINFLSSHNVDIVVGFDTEQRAVSHTSKSLRKLQRFREEISESSFLVCQSDARNISWLPSEYFDALVAHALLVYIPKNEICDVVFALCQKMKVGGRVYFGYMWDAIPFSQAMHCLSRLDVAIIVVREDHLFADYYRGNLTKMTVPYFESPGIAVTVLSRRTPTPAFDETNTSGTLFFPTSTGMAFRYLPSDANIMTLEIWGTCCTPLMISLAVPCLGASPQYPGERNTTVVRCAGASFATCSDVLHALAKNKCGCEEASCARTLLRY